MSLAWAAAIAGKMTLLVECDLRRAVLAGRLGIGATPGLTDYAGRGAAEPQDVLQPVDIGVAGRRRQWQPAAGSSRLVCITARTPVPDPAELLASARFTDFLAKVCGDLRPRHPRHRPAALGRRHAGAPAARRCGGLLRRSYQTTRDQARATREALDSASIRFAHLVVTGLKLRDDDYSGYYRRYVQGFPGAES